MKSNQGVMPLRIQTLQNYANHHASNERYGSRGVFREGVVDQRIFHGRGWRVAWEGS